MKHDQKQNLGNIAIKTGIKIALLKKHKWAFLAY